MIEPQFGINIEDFNPEKENTTRLLLDIWVSNTLHKIFLRKYNLNHTNFWH